MSLRQIEFERMIEAIVNRNMVYRFHDELRAAPTNAELNRRTTRAWIRETIVRMDDEKLDAIVPELIAVLRPNAT